MWRPGAIDVSPVRSLSSYAKRWLVWDDCSSDVELGCSLEMPRHERAARFRWVCLALPWDLLSASVAAADAPQARLPTILRRPVRLRPDPAALEIADTHLHVAASFEYGQVWTGLMLSAYAGRLSLASLPRDREMPFGGALELAAQLYEAAIIRVAIAVHFMGETECRSGVSNQGRDHESGRRVLLGDGTLERLLAKLSDPSDVYELRRIERAWTRPRSATQMAPNERGARARILLRRIVGRVCASRAAHGKRLVGHPPTTLPDLSGSDPIGLLWLQLPRGGVDHWEHALQVRLLRELATRGRLSRLGLQYLRVFAQLYRYVVQEPGVGGLDWFRRHYARVEALTAPLGRLSYFDVVTRLEASRATPPTHKLVAVEVRTTPKRTWPEVKQKVERTRRPRGLERSMEIGVVLHYIREESPLIRRSRSSAWYDWWHLSRRKEAAAVAHLIRLMPGTLRVLCGIDAANNELAVPTWTQLPLFSVVLDAVDEVKSSLRFGLTSHVGEDYRTLHEGVRRIDEMLSFFESQVDRPTRLGFRLGHALALGASPRRWAASRAGEVLQPRIERMWDIVWELELSRHARIHISATRRGHHVRQAAMIARDIKLAACLGISDASEDAAVVERLVVFRNQLNDPRWLRAVRYPVMSPSNGPGSVCALAEVSVLERGRSPIRVVVDEEEVRALDSMQAWVRRRARRLGVTIEANPSSNLLVGDMGGLERHPILALAPVGAPAVLPVSLNSDDPLTFATTVADEYAYMRATLEAKGYSSADVADWLAARARDGRRSRFTT